MKRNLNKMLNSSKDSLDRKIARVSFKKGSDCTRLLALSEIDIPKKPSLAQAYHLFVSMFWANIFVSLEELRVNSG